MANRLLLTLCLLVVACAGVSPPSAVAQEQEQPVTIESSALTFKIDEPKAARVGRLVWRGGLEMRANLRNFGGLSALHVTPDNRTLTSISDEGAWLVATPRFDANGTLVGLGDARMGQLRGLDGKPIASKPEADAEAFARLPDGSWLVAFERRHRLWRYPSLTATPLPVEGPADIGRQPANGGIEAMAALADGTVIAISEEYTRQPETVVGWIGKPDGSDRYTWSSFSYATLPDYRPTALAVLPDGSFVTLERAFDMVRGVRVRVMRFDAAGLKPGATVKPEELALLSSPYAVDNLEGLAATRGARGETLLWLISDDNFNPLQRNILMLFELAQ